MGESLSDEDPWLSPEQDVFLDLFGLSRGDVAPLLPTWGGEPLGLPGGGEAVPATPLGGWKGGLSLPTGFLRRKRISPL